MSKEKIERALERFQKGYNCAETLLIAGAEILGIKKDLIPNIATCFGGGIGRRESICGAISGAIMAIGLKYGRKYADDKESKERAYNLAINFCEKFEKKFGSLICYELIRLNLKNPADRKKFQDLKIMEEKCFRFIATSCRILMDILTQEK
ncbi:MAG: C-GCAxxG-C-C family protein [Candidatus Aminicenantia bacterium]